MYGSVYRDLYQTDHCHIQYVKYDFGSDHLSSGTGEEEEERKRLRKTGGGEKQMKRGGGVGGEGKSG